MTEGNIIKNKTSLENSSRTKNNRIFKQMGLIVVAFLLSLILGSGTVAVVWATNNMPTWDPQGLHADLTTFIYDKNRNVIAELHSNENRVYVDLNKMPANLKNAFVATEDNRFYQHRGVDFRAIARALVANFKGGRAEEGASTITQQLVKNAYLTPEKTYTRKFQEVMLSLNVERKFSKDEILEMYVNRIYFGHGSYGVEAAAKSFFGKHVYQLNLAECALLAGIPRRPGDYDPYRFPKDVKLRRNTVIELMVKYGYITLDVAEKAKKEPINLVPLKAPTYKYPFFVDYVIQEAKEKNTISEEQIYRGGLRIYTSLDPRAQSTTEKQFANPKNFPRGKSDQQVQGGMVILDYRNGEIKAIVGGRKHEARLGYNRATQLMRQPGSTFKPIAVYAPALDKGYSNKTVLVDAPVQYGKYTPKNADGNYRGPITMEEALRSSVNVYAVKMLNKIGIVEGYTFAQKLGFDLDKNDEGYPLALGGLTKGTNPLEMASAFGTFANQGRQVEAHAITQIVDSKDAPVYEAKLDSQQVMKPQKALALTAMLKGAVDNGTGNKARMKWPVAGKTGTTQLPFKGAKGHKDVWFVGYTPELVAAVWMGYDKTNRKHYLTTFGGDYPAMMFKKVMSKVLVGKKVQKFKIYGGYTRAKVCSTTGLIPLENCSYRKETFIKGTEPQAVCDGNHKEFWNYAKTKVKEDAEKAGKEGTKDKGNKPKATKPVPKPNIPPTTIPEPIPTTPPIPQNQSPQNKPTEVPDGTPME